LYKALLRARINYWSAPQVMSSVAMKIVIALACFAAAQSSGSVEQREHNPEFCQPRLGADGGSTRMEDIALRDDACCASQADFSCGESHEVVGTTKVCSTQDSEIKLFEYNCYPDNSEIPIGSLIVLVACVALCFAIATAMVFVYRKFQAPDLPEEKAMFNKRDSKALTGSSTGSDSIKEFAGRLSRSKSRLSESESNGTNSV